MPGNTTTERRVSSFNTCFDYACIYRKAQSPSQVYKNHQPRPRLYHGVGWGRVAKGAVHLSASAAIASVLLLGTQSVPRPPLMLSQMMTALFVVVLLPHGLVTVKFLKVMFSQTALGLELQVNLATARPYLPLVVPEKFSKDTFVTLTWDG